MIHTLAADHLEPWRTWGTTETLEFDLSQPFGGFGFGRLTANLVNIEHAFPTTWTVLLGVRLTLPPGAVFVGSPNPYFNFSVGVGRVNERIDGVWSPLLPTTPGGTVSAWASNFRGQVDTTAGLAAAGTLPISPNIDIGEIPAQSLQIQGGLDFQGGGIATISFTALCAPKTHIRPEWFKQAENEWGRRL